MWTVMTSAARMPNNCWGKYRNVALVQLNQHYTANGYTPRMISTRARGVLRVEEMGHFHVGTTDRCAYERALQEALRRAEELNTAAPLAQEELLMTWGGSA